MYKIFKLFYKCLKRLDKRFLKVFLRVLLTYRPLQGLGIYSYLGIFSYHSHNLQQSFKDYTQISRMFHVKHWKGL